MVLVVGPEVLAALVVAPRLDEVLGQLQRLVGAARPADARGQRGVVAQQVVQLDQGHLGQRWPGICGRHGGGPRSARIRSTILSATSRSDVLPVARAWWTAA